MNNIKILCVIPSRIGSTRLPRKALLPIQGKPMIQWTYENARRCRSLTKLVVATDSLEIAEVILGCGGTVEMTILISQKKRNAVSQRKLASKVYSGESLQDLLIQEFFLLGGLAEIVIIFCILRCSR